MRVLQLSRQADSTSTSPSAAPPTIAAARPHRLILPHGGEVQVVQVAVPGAPPAGAAIAFVPQTAGATGALLLLVEGAPEATAEGFARRVHEGLAAEHGVAASRLIRAMGTGCRAVERRMAQGAGLARFGCTALLLESTVQRYAFISQLPPCQAYAWDGSELIAQPAEPMLGAGQSGGAARTCEVELDVNRVPLRAGATFLLAPAALGAVLPAGAVRDLLRLPLAAAAEELRRVLGAPAASGGEAILVRIPGGAPGPRVRLFAAPLESPTRLPAAEDVLPAGQGRRPALHPWGLEAERSALSGWLDSLPGRRSGQRGSDFHARRPRTRRTALLIAAAGLPLGVLALGAWRRRSEDGAATVPEEPPAAEPAPRQTLAGRTVLQADVPLRAMAPGAQGGAPLVLDGLDRLWRVEGAGVTAVALTRAGAVPLGAGSLLARREETVLWLDPRRALWSWREGEPEGRQTLLRDASAWRRPVGLATHEGHLFVLDSGDAGAAGQVWRYAPNAGGSYDARPQPWVPGSTAFLRNATGCAMDGALWISRDDGTIVRLVSGRPEPFAAADLETSIGHAAAIATAPAMRSLYVLDTVSRRLVQLSKTGRFEAQIPDVIDAGDPVRGLWVDGSAGRALILTEQRLQEVPLGAVGGR